VYFDAEYGRSLDYDAEADNREGGAAVAGPAEGPGGEAADMGPPPSPTAPQRERASKGPAGRRRTHRAPVPRSPVTAARRKRTSQAPAGRRRTWARRCRRQRRNGSARARGRRGGGGPTGRRARGCAAVGGPSVGGAVDGGRGCRTGRCLWRGGGRALAPYGALLTAGSGRSRGRAGGGSRDVVLSSRVAAWEATPTEGHAAGRGWGAPVEGRGVAAWRRSGAEAEGRGRQLGRGATVGGCGVGGAVVRGRRRQRGGSWDTALPSRAAT
jgi:hypothetical protein